jgi:hypothetical protein
VNVSILAVLGFSQINDLGLENGEALLKTIKMRKPAKQHSLSLPEALFDCSGL